MLCAAAVLENGMGPLHQSTATATANANIVRERGEEKRKGRKNEEKIYQERYAVHGQANQSSLVRTIYLVFPCCGSIASMPRRKTPSIVQDVFLCEIYMYAAARTWVSSVPHLLSFGVNIPLVLCSIPPPTGVCRRSSKSERWRKQRSQIMKI